MFNSPTWAKSPLVVVLAGCLVSCSFGPNPKKDLQQRVEIRLKQHPYFKIDNIQKYVKEEEEGKNHEYYYKISYKVIDACYFNALNAPGPDAITLELCSKKNGFLSSRIQAGGVITEVACVSYRGNKLSDVEFRSINSIFQELGEVEK